MRSAFHYTLTTVDEVPAFTATTGPSDLAPRYNLAPGQTAPVVLMRDGGRVREHLRWGLLPRWRGHGGKRGALVHAAPLEAVPATPLLRDSLKKQRCLVIADGCFAWRELKQPIWFHPEPCCPVAFAGVWNLNDDDGQLSFAMLLGPPLVTRVNDPMPIVIGADAHEPWLDPSIKPEAALELLAGAPLATWRADAVSTRMSSPTHDDPACVAPLGNPNQRELF